MIGDFPDRGGHSIFLKGVTAIDVEIAGHYALQQFAVVDALDEIILGMDFLRQNEATWDVASNELRFSGGVTVFAQRAIAELDAAPTHRVRLAREEEIPPNSQAVVRVKVKRR